MQELIRIGGEAHRPVPVDGTTFERMAGTVAQVNDIAFDERNGIEPGPVSKHEHWRTIADEDVHLAHAAVAGLDTRDDEATYAGISGPAARALGRTIAFAIENGLTIGAPKQPVPGGSLADVVGLLSEAKEGARWA